MAEIERCRPYFIGKGDNPILFLSRRKMDQKKIKENKRLESEGVFGHTSPMPESQVFAGEILTDSKFCA